MRNIDDDRHGGDSSYRSPSPYDLQIMVAFVVKMIIAAVVVIVVIVGIAAVTIVACVIIVVAATRKSAVAKPEAVTDSESLNPKLQTLLHQESQSKKA